MKLLISFLAGAVITGVVFYFAVYVPMMKKNKIPPSMEDVTSESLRGLSEILIDSAKASTYINNYRAEHDTLRDSTITYSIFFGRDAIRFMGHYFDTASENVAGVSVFNIQYNETLRTANYQKHPKQQSILFMPQDSSGKILWNEWIKSSAAIKSSNLVDAINHGELCPNRCPND